MGQWYFGQPQGLGVMTEGAQDSLVLYSGQFKEGTRHGLGRAEWHSLGCWYEGEWVSDVQHGVGEVGKRPTMEDPTPAIKIWRLEGGHQVQELSLSQVGKVREHELLTLSLEVDRQDTNLGEPFLQDAEVVIPKLGIAVGDPDQWLSSCYGALIITRIIPKGALMKFNEAQRAQKGQEVWPNSWIWRVGGVSEDPWEMLSSLKVAVEAEPSKRKEKVFVQLAVRRPVAANCLQMKKNLGLREGWAKPVKQTIQDEGWRPWLEPSQPVCISHESSLALSRTHGGGPNWLGGGRSPSGAPSSPTALASPAHRKVKAGQVRVNTRTTINFKRKVAPEPEAAQGSGAQR